MRLQEAGFAVRILTRELPADTTSAVAAAIWHPYKAYPEDRVAAWSLRSFEVYRQLAGDDATGVYFLPLIELFRGPAPEPGWRSSVPGARRMTRAELDELGQGRFPAAYRIEVPVIQTPIYLPWLFERFSAGGGTVEVRPQGAPPLAELVGPGHVTVCCVGLGARELLGDGEVFPIRGQVVRVTNPGLAASLVDDWGPEEPTYVIPRRQDVILGGTAIPGEEDLTADAAVTESVLERTARLEPRLAEAEVLGVRVGLRPGRSAVRLEREELPGGTVLYNYGHGGAGYTLSWGCADEVAERALEATSPVRATSKKLESRGESR